MQHVPNRHNRPVRLFMAAAGTALALSLVAQTMAPRVLSSGPLGRTAVVTRHQQHRVAVAPHAVAAYTPIAHIRAGAGVIVQNGQAPFPGALYRFVNHWYEVKQGVTIIVYAGMERTTSHGVVIVMEAADGYTRVVGPYIYRTPARTGAVRVVGAQGERLSLAAEHGAPLAFDVPSGTFATQ